MRTLSPAKLIPVLFVLSGATALVGEVVWMRMLGLVLGNTVWAAATVVAVWMGGMALGAAVGARLAPRTRHHLRWYGIAELVIGLCYVMSPMAQRALLKAGTLLGEDLGQHLMLGVGQRMLLAAGALLLPTVLMGLTLPLLVERVQGSQLSASVATLYGANTVGAAAGVFAAGYVLLPALGESGSLATAACLCALVGTAGVALEGVVPRHLAEVAPRASVGRESGFLLLAALMGFAALSAELIWVRILVLHLGSRVYAFALLLGVYLLGLGLGSLAVRAWAGRLGEPRRALARVQVAAALLLVVQLGGLGFTGDLMAWITATTTPSGSFAGLQFVMLTAVLVLFLPVTVLFGASFPLTAAAAHGERGAGETVGRVAAANTLGSIAGALVAPFLLIPWLGSQRSLLVVALIHLVVALALRPARSFSLPLAATALAVLVVWWTVPPDWVLRQAGAVEDDGAELVELKESLGATVLVKRYTGGPRPWLSLELNGVNVAGTDPALLVVQQLQGILPLLQVDNPRRVLHVGFGSGGTCWAVSRHPVERIDVVEISPEVLRAADRYFPDVNHGVLHDPRVRVIINDGRNYLLATDATYDAILSDSIHPLYAGNSTLYTREYFELCRSRLNPGGVVSMWLPLYNLDRESYLRILRAFHEVFPQTVVWYDTTTVNENTVVTGRVDEGPVPIDWNRLDDPGISASAAIAGIERSSEIVSTILLGPTEVSRLTALTPPLSDDLPYVEYISGRLLDRNRSWYSNLTMLVADRAMTNPLRVAQKEWVAAMEIRDLRLTGIVQSLSDSLTAP